MNRTALLIGFAVVALLLFFSKKRGQRSSMGLATIPYQGQEIHLSKQFGSYEDFKDDPDNLDTNELSRIESLMTNARVPNFFKTRKEFVERVLRDLKFPGYGAGFSGEMPQSDGSTLELVALEIPGSDKSRFLLCRSESAGGTTLIDDLVTNWPYAGLGASPSLSVRLQNGTVSYTLDSNVVRTIPLK